MNKAIIMRKLIFLLLFFPLISYAQYGESRYVKIGVVDQYGNSIGTLSMMARHVDTYSNGYEVAVDRYIQYLKEKETKERAERQRNALNQRLRGLGISEVPSWDTNGIYAAAMQGYASSVERRANNTSYSSSKRVSESEYNEMIKGYNELVIEYNSNVSQKKFLKRKSLINGSVSVSKWNSDVGKKNKLIKEIKKIREKNKKDATEIKNKNINNRKKFLVQNQILIDDAKKNNPELVYVISNSGGISKEPKYTKDYLGFLSIGDEVVLVSKDPINKNYYKIKYNSKSSDNYAFIPKYLIKIRNKNLISSRAKPIGLTLDNYSIGNTYYINTSVYLHKKKTSKNKYTGNDWTSFEETDIVLRKGDTVIIVGTAIEKYVEVMYKGKTGYAILYALSN